MKENEQAKVEKKNEDLKKKWAKVLTKLNQEKEAKKESGNMEDSTETTVRFAYIVFRSMDALDHVFNAYKVGSCRRCCIMKCG
jgi:hypothetical protein